MLIDVVLIQDMSLHLFLAESLLGPWREHPLSPIVPAGAQGKRIGRSAGVLHSRLLGLFCQRATCAGTPLWLPDGLHRFAQVGALSSCPACPISAS